MPIPTFTYICWDDVTRTRCRNHIPATGPGRPLPAPYHRATADRTGRPRCYQCLMQGIDTSREEGEPMARINWNS